MLNAHLISMRKIGKIGKIGVRPRFFIKPLTDFFANEGFPEVIYSTLFSFYKHIAFESENEIRLAVVDSNADINKENTNNGIILKVENTMELIDIISIFAK
ncbi:MAG: hypothetical protein D3923_15535 [Candidatus Electrothrix sp. AR3]|nr:hypothetical protein [Candidatus Electrothrix sp. AR3]